MRISLIAAMAKNRVIGRQGHIPWKIPGEQKLFKKITCNYGNGHYDDRKYLNSNHLYMVCLRIK